jgi:hypothetical protein
MAAKSATARTNADILAEIRRLRQSFVGMHQHRAGVLEDCLEQKRAEVVADQILALESELTK